MPFELKNAPANFQKAMDVILDTVKWEHAKDYTEDIIIFSPTSRDHVKHVKSGLHLLSEAGMELKLNRCHFFSDAIDYLEHMITSSRLHVETKADEI